jgi:hypothetical protein
MAFWRHRLTIPLPESRTGAKERFRCKSDTARPGAATYRAAHFPRRVTRSKVKTCSWGASTQQPKRRRRS